MNRQMRLYCTSVVWRCAVAFILCTCAITIIHSKLADTVERRSASTDSYVVCNLDNNESIESSAATISEVVIPISATTEDVDTQETTEDVELESRYEPITAEETEILARLVYLEARGESAEGQQAVAEVVLNRVASDQFPDTVAEVIYQEGQFSPSGQIDSVTPTVEQYEAVYNAQYGEAVLPMEVVFFATRPENSNLWGWIGNHAFCYAYDWGD